MLNPDQMKQRQEKRAGMQTEDRKVAALEEIADQLVNLNSQIASIAFKLNR